VAAKSFLHDAPSGSFKVTIFEAQPRIGGLWPARKDDAAGLVHPLMVANQSKHTMQFSDLAWEPGTPEFPRAWQVGQYLDRYLKRYCQDAELKLGTRVNSATPVPTSPSDSTPATRWNLLIESTGGEVEERKFDYLLISTGFFGKAALPPQRSFENGIPTIHSSEYRNLKGLVGDTSGKGGKILVVGGQMSGVEIAGTIASHISSAMNSPGTSTIPNITNYSIHHIVQRPIWVVPLHTSPKV
jgi:cation diffusion facilitator CzcD-associated flavoprotein CzcO